MRHLAGGFGGDGAEEAQRRRQRMDLSRYCPDWSLDEDGIWRALDVRDVSYPSEGNDRCFQIEDESLWFRHRNRVITSLVARFAPSGPFFDVGGGNGFVALQLQSRGLETVLVEPGAAGVAHAKRRGVAHVVQGMWAPERIAAGSVAAVGLFDVVEHIEDDLEFLRGVNRTLALGGLLFMTVPAISLLWSRDDVDAGHFRRYRRRVLRQLLHDAGFVCEFMTYFFWPLPLPILVRRTLPGRFGFRRGVDLGRTRREHSLGPSLLRGLMGQALEWEAGRISRLKTMPVGSSCALVARRAEPT